MVAGLRRWESWVVAGLPPGQVRAGRAAVRFASGVAPWGLFFCVVFAGLGLTSLATSIGLAGLGVGVVPLVLRKTGSLPFAAHFMNAFLAQSLLVCAWGVGGLLAACVPWLAICVVTATFLSGPRAGLAWMLLSTGFTWVLFGAHLGGMVPKDPVPMQVIWGLAAMAHSGLFVVVLVFVTGAVSVNARAQDELEQAVAAAGAANQAKSDFLAQMSHELRTPMNAVIGYAELMLEDARPQDRLDLGQIQAAGRHLLQLINEVLDLSKVSAGQMPFVSADVDAADVVRRVIDGAAPLLLARCNHVAFEGTAPVWVRADPLRLEQCVLNLVSNAAKFTEGGTIRVWVDTTATAATISVEDSGIGIPQDQLERIFQPFLQATPQTHRTHGGTGLGLALVKAFATGMEGHVDVESTVGVGSTFRLTLPLAQRADEDAVRAGCG